MKPNPRVLILAAAGLLPAALPTLAGAQLGVLWLGYCALLLFALGLDAVSCRRARQLELDLELPELLYIDGAAEARISLALATARPVAGEVTLDLGETLEPAKRHAVSLAASPTEVRLPLVARRRGPARVEGLWVRFDGPLGLVRRAVHRRLDRVLEVVPNTPLVRGVALRFLNARSPLAGVKVEHYVGEGSEFESLREFTAGLDPRSIDWKASARHTRLLSRETRAERNHQIVLGLDTGRLMAEPLSGVPLLDHAIHSALVLALISLRHGDRVSLFPFAGRPGSLTPPRGGMRTLATLVRATGELDYTSEETNFTLALTDLLTRLRRRSLVVVFTDFVDSVTAELMTENLLRLRRRHLVVFVALRDPTLGELVDREPRTVLDMDRAVVAGTLLRERERTLGRLRQAGIFTLDAPPARIGPQLLNRYLEIKRREMI